MKQYQSLNPSDSCVYIDYRKKDNPVRFEYPKKYSAFKVCFESFTNFWLSINLLIAIIFIIGLGIFLIFQISFLDETTTTTEGTYVIELIKGIVFMAFYLLFSPLFAAILFSSNKKLLSQMPTVNKFMAMFPLKKHYYSKLEKIKNKKFEITDFDNIFLNYNATEEFSKYLSRVEITEDKSDYIKITIFGKREKKGVSNGWKATFYFDKTPKKGYLEVWYK